MVSGSSYSPFERKHPRLDTPLGTVVTVPTAFFLAHLLPQPVSEADVSKVLSKLQRTGKKKSPWKPITQRGRWRGFAKDPSVEHCDDSAAYRNFHRIGDYILDAAKSVLPGVTPSFGFKTNPAPLVMLQPRQLSGNWFPDAYFSPNERSDSPMRWVDVAACVEYRKVYTPANAELNTGKITNSMCVCMANDARRRFMLGMSLEDTDLRLWYCDRSHIVVAEPFNFITDHFNVVKVFLSFFYAKPHQLGWDPSVTIVDQNAEPLRYDIIVRDGNGCNTVYRTLQSLTTVDARSLRGRGTKVWKAVEIRNGEECGEPVVLKDSWVSAVRDREGVVWEDVQKRASESEASQQAFSAGFLTILHHGDVFTDIEGSSKLDRTWIPPIHMSESGTVDDSSKIFSGRRKVHYRAVFREVCKRIEDDVTLSDVFRYLAQICDALKILHESGWVHRDISAGNILLDSAGRAKLVDLEFARRMDDENVGHSRVGTYNFMAIEIHVGGYIFRPPPPYLSPSPEPDAALSQKITEAVLNNGIGLQELLASIPHKERPPDRPNYPFRYNPLHDMESLWWMAIYFLCKRDLAATEAAGSEADARRAANLRQWTNRLFYDALDRRFAVRDGDTLECALSSLRPSLRTAAGMIRLWRAILVEHYKRIEKDIPSITHRVADGLHDIFKRDLLKVADTMADLPLPPTSEQNPAKVPADKNQGATESNLHSASKRTWSESDNIDDPEEVETIRAVTRSRKKTKISSTLSSNGGPPRPQTRSQTRLKTKSARDKSRQMAGPSLRNFRR